MKLLSIRLRRVIIMTTGTDDDHRRKLCLLITQVERQQVARPISSPLPEFISNTTLDAVTSKSKVHIFLPSKVHVILTIQVQKETKNKNVSQTT